MRIALLTLQALCLLASPLHAAPAEVEVSNVRKAKDKVTVVVQADRVAFTVLSSDGIGSFNATLKNGQWPDVVTFTVNRKRLEHFELMTDRIRATGMVTPAEGGSCEFSFRNAKGEVDAEGAAGSLKVAVKETPEGLELTFPRHLLGETKRITFQWIDAYRR